jgi:DNA-binding CsgD family transcriptional regulator
MRVVLVGEAGERARLRQLLSSSAIEIVGEAATIAAAHAAEPIADAILLAPGPRAADSRRAEDLTPRELEVLQVLAEGLPNKAIARRLGISDQTVKFHLAAICGKLGAQNRTDAVRLAIQRGLITV